MVTLMLLSCQIIISMLLSSQMITSNKKENVIIQPPYPVILQADDNINAFILPDENINVTHTAR
jgi:hypothetical protein